MTSERRIVVGLGDIRAVTFECKSCGVRVSYQPDDSHLMPVNTNCPACNEDWWTTSTTRGSVFGTQADIVANLLTGLQGVRKLADQKSVGFRLLLEYDEPTT